MTEDGGCSNINTPVYSKLSFLILVLLWYILRFDKSKINWIIIQKKHLPLDAWSPCPLKSAVLCRPHCSGCNAEERGHRRLPGVQHVGSREKGPHCDNISNTAAKDLSQNRRLPPEKWITIQIDTKIPNVWPFPLFSGEFLSRGQTIFAKSFAFCREKKEKVKMRKKDICLSRRSQYSPNRRQKILPQNSENAFLLWPQWTKPSFQN